MFKLDGKVVNAVRVGDSDAGRIVGQSLKALREMAGLTQNQMAVRLNVRQAAISKIEHRGNVQISSLQRYVEALGAKLRIDAAFPVNADALFNLIDIDDVNLIDKNQLVLPIFGAELPAPQRDMVLSIRPPYSDKILSGEKTVELRRRFPVTTAHGTVVYIYSTSPTMAIIGRAEIAEVVRLPISDIWDNYGGLASIEKTEFDSYFSGVDEGYALKFANVRPFPRELKLDELRARFGFEPPQSFLYANPELRRVLRNEYSNVSY